MLSTMTYAMTILSLVSSICLTNATEKTLDKSTQQVFRSEKMSATTYYNPVYVEDNNVSQAKWVPTIRQIYKPTLLIDVYQN